MPAKEDPDSLILSLSCGPMIPPHTMQQCALYVKNKALAQLTRSHLSFGASCCDDEYEMHVVPHHDSDRGPVA